MSSEQWIRNNLIGLKEYIKEEDVFEHYIGVVAEMIVEYTRNKMTKGMVTVLNKAIEAAQEMHYKIEDQNNQKGIQLQKWQTCYAVPKQSIENLKKIVETIDQQDLN